MIRKKLLPVWRNLPEGFRQKIAPAILRANLMFDSIIGTNFIGTMQGIGWGQVPRLSRPYSKWAFAQQGEDLILDRILYKLLGKGSDFKGTYVDVGAFHPIEHSVTYLLYLRGWKGVAFDASPHTESLFKRIRPKDAFVRAVVGDIDASSVDFFYHHPSAGLSLTSSKFPDKAHMEEYEKVTLQQVNLSKELKRRGIVHVDVLSLDVEGAELEVLSSFNWREMEPTVIAVEIHGYNLQAIGQSEVARLIFSKGYIWVGSAVLTQFFVKSEEILRDPRVLVQESDLHPES